MKSVRYLNYLIRHHLGMESERKVNVELDGASNNKRHSYGI
jgi:hypothetical protein